MNEPIGDHTESDELLGRLRAEDPAAVNPESEERLEAIRRRVLYALEADRHRSRCPIPALPLLVIVAGLVVAIRMGRRHRRLRSRRRCSG
jgi:hypothetical protein